MNLVTFSQPLRGIVPPLVTPLLARDQLDEAGLERLLEYVLAGGVHGLFILGTTGEGTSLSYRLREELTEHVCRQVRGRVPVLVGITDTAFMESVRVARHAAEKGAAAVVLAPPYYLPEGQPELREYLDHLLPELSIPLFLYNMPPLTKVPFAVETVSWAMDHPEIVGIKDSSGDMNYFHQLCLLAPRRPEWTILVGPEHLLAESVLLGGHGGVNGGANLLPRLYVDLYEAACLGDLPRIRRLHHIVVQVGELLYRVGHHPSSIIKGIKCGLSCMGLCNDFMAEPFHKFRPPERLKIEQALARIQELIQAAG
ncbi:MAG TPA: dihydrodipicolinate synthase family protein [Candidatus Paceibacterota bacterium]|nr:dihydrodipicolinate synthase family protein [Verrucomicrobiota bacterium]HRY49484.1 dihydrodipicolinate synthase family protein [Candidatus Paceibacterota bacterium]HRZ99309.1 dihydrodipicolinate synthase family protein [Candidatus Paceibacterota bacterium]